MAAPRFAPDNPHGLILYDHPSSPCARRVRITLLEKGLGWETQLIDLSRLEQRDPAYLALNPNGFVPTLAHGERVIYESNVITEYLDDAFPEMPLYPREPWQRVQVKMWQAAELAMAKDYRPLMYQRVMGPMVHLTRSLDQALAAARRSTSDPADLAWEEKVWRLAVLAPEDEAATEARLWQWLERLDRQLDGRAFLVGERFTQAEISVFPRVMMYAFVNLPITPARFPHVSRWIAALRDRPSFASTLSSQDRQLLQLSKTGLLPWLGRTLRKPRRSLGERLRLAVLRRMARRRLGDTDASPPPRPSLRQPRTGVIPPADSAAQRGPAPAPEVQALPLTLYDFADSPHARRIRILLQEKSLTWQTVDVDLRRDAHQSAEYLAINPNGEVPALRHGERILCDSQVIAEYLDRTYPGNPLYPDDAFGLARVRMWLALEAGTHKELRPLFARHVLGRNGAVRFDTSEELAREIIAKKLAHLDAQLAGGAYLVGDCCTMADIGWYTRIDLLPRLGVPIDAARYPHIAPWLARMRQRPSVAD